MLLTKNHKTKARNIARSAWIRSDGDAAKAEKIVRDEGRYTFGILTWLLVANAVISICYTLWQWWNAANMHTPPTTPAPGEPEC